MTSQVFSVRRKPAPPLDPRYPSPDPSDPFAPLWVLRSRVSNTNFPVPCYTNRTFAESQAFPVKAGDDAEATHYRRRRAQSSPVTTLSSEITIAGRGNSRTYRLFMASAHFEPIAAPVPQDGTGVQYVNPSLQSLQQAKPLLVKAHSFAPHASVKRGKLHKIKTRSRSVADSLREAPPQRNSPEKPLDKRLISSPAHFKHLVSGNEIQFSHSLLNPGDGKGLVEFPSPSPTSRRRGLTQVAARQDQHLTEIITSTASSPPLGPPSISRSTGQSIAKPMKTTWTRRHSTTGTPNTKVEASQQSGSKRRSRAPSKPIPLDAAMPQSEWSFPHQQSLSKAASLPVVTESGLRIPFGSLLTSERTIVIFIRHFWCSHCQDYMASLTSLAHPELMVTELTPPMEGGAQEKSSLRRVQVIIIGNGSHTMIAKYRRMFKMPFNIYTDPTLALHRVLGLSRLDVAQLASTENLPSYTTGKNVQDGGYGRRGRVGSFAAAVGRALKVGMPVWADGGDKQQLGGEFVFGPAGTTCTFAHRMQSTRGHVPAGDVLAAAGIDLPSLVRLRDAEVPVKLSRGPSLLGKRVQERRRKTPEVVVPVGQEEIRSPKRRSVSFDGTVNSRSAFVVTSDDEEEWMARRMRSLERLKEKKNRRRGTFAGFSNEVNPPYSRKQTCAPVDERDEHIFIADEDGIAAIAQVTLLQD